MAELVIIVFTDIVNSTDLKLKLPGRDVNERNRAYIDTILTTTP
jgi:hypothetical protein